jgi:hypothetical protein
LSWPISRYYPKNRLIGLRKSKRSLNHISHYLTTGSNKDLPDISPELAGPFVYLFGNCPLFLVISVLNFTHTRLTQSVERLTLLYHVQDTHPTSNRMLLEKSSPGGA